MTPFSFLRGAAFAGGSLREEEKKNPKKNDCLPPPFCYKCAVYSSALLGPSLDKFEKIRIKVGLVLVAICDKTEYTN